MKNTQFTIIVAFCLIFSTGIGSVTAFQTPESIIAAGNVYVSNITSDPGTFLLMTQGRSR